MVRWQLRNLAKDEQVSCVAKMKTGPSIEVEDYILSFQYMEERRREWFAALASTIYSTCTDSQCKTIRSDRIFK